MDACPLCEGTTGYKQNMLVEFERQTQWADVGNYCDAPLRVAKKYARRYCMDCGECVSKLLDTPVFKL